MIDLSNESLCCGCMACSAVCPKDCISMVYHADGCWYPQIDTSSCVHCGRCERVCPIITIPSVNRCERTSFVAYNKDEEIRHESSSGGVFSVLAEQFMVSDGIIVAATIKNGAEIEHVMVNNAPDIVKLRGSKYPQSNTINVYKIIDECLENCERVMFVGTPCQCGAIANYCGKNRDKLLLVDFVCHGVISPGIWSDYCKYCSEKHNGSRVISASFRKKNNSWRRYDFCMEFENNDKYQISSSCDPLMKAYQLGLCIRASCHQCHYKGNSRSSDITLGDSWGIEHYCKEMDDDKGTSLVICHTLNGEKLIDLCNDYLVKKEVNVDEAYKYNQSALVSTPTGKNRERYLRDYQEQGFQATIKYCRDSVMTQIKKRIKRTMSIVLYKSE